MVVCMSTLILTLELYLGDVFPGQYALANLNPCGSHTRLSDAFDFGFRGSLPIYRTPRLALLCESNEFLKPLKTLISAQIVIEGITVQK